MSKEGPAKPSGIVATIRGTVGSITSMKASVRTFDGPLPMPMAPVRVASTSSRPPGVTMRVRPVALYPLVKRKGVSTEGRTVRPPGPRIQSKTSRLPGKKREVRNRLEVATKRRPPATMLPAVKLVRKLGAVALHRESRPTGCPFERKGSGGNAHASVEIPVRRALVPGAGSRGKRSGGIAAGTSISSSTGRPVLGSTARSCS